MVFVFFPFLLNLYVIVNVSYKIQYISMHLLQSKHTLHNLSSNLSVHVVKRFSRKWVATLVLHFNDISCTFCISLL